MARFRHKRIAKGQTLGDRLKRARLEQNISLEEVHIKINIQLQYLQILEDGDYQRLPGDIYAKIWIKLYGEFLGLPIKELLDSYKLEKSISDKIKGIDKISNTGISIKENFLLKPRTLKLAVISLVVIALLGYLGWEVKDIIAAPEIIILEPANNYITTDSSVMIIGRTEAEVQLSINNEPILIDEYGNFKQIVNLSMGLNKLEINAKKKHSKTNKLEWNILREQL